MARPVVAKKSSKKDLPAIEGGSPVRETLLPYGHQTLGTEEEKAVLEVLRSDYITQGPKVKEFESKIAKLVGKKHAVAVSNGTAALHCAAFAAGLGPGDEAITSPITFLASANCIAYMGATPKFADIRLDTYNIDPVDVKGAITSRTKALIPVDFAGQPADYKELSELAKDKGIMIIEDAAHALGATYKGRSIGHDADLVTLSFHPVKHITTGEGGAVATDDDELFWRLQTFRNHGLVRDPGRLGSKDEGGWFYEMQMLGYNYRLTDLQCALGLAQLSRLKEFIHKRRQVAKAYTKALGAIEGIIPMIELPDRKCVYHIYMMRFDPKQFKADRRRVFDALRAENIGVNVHYIPVHLQPFYRQTFGYKEGDFPKAEEYYKTAITLPVFPAMTRQDVEDVVVAIQKVMEFYRK
jgi:UDP-4-amino-4,6-dideoxy-N-acetyl-beta-L-altrosamine transaminase